MLKVELGGGEHPIYHPNIDICPYPQVDIVHDLIKGIPLPDESASLIFSQDFAEHLLFLDFLNLLKECKRVLIDGGMIDFIIPDINKTLETYTEYNNHVHHMLVGEWYKDKPEIRHKMWFTPELMEYILTKEGWRYIKWEYSMLDADWWKEPKFRTVAIK